MIRQAASAAAALALLLVLAPPGSAVDQPAPAQSSGQPSQEVVVRLAGGDRAATAAALARDGWAAADTVVLVDGGVWTDALVGAHLAARLDAPVLVSGTHLPEATRQTVQALAPDRLVVIGEATTDGLDVAVTDRVTGATPADLAVAALGVVPMTGAQPWVVASEATFPDALAAGNLAPAGLLLTDPSRLSQATADLIAAQQPAEVVVVGGGAAVTEDVIQQISDLGPQVRRIAGGSRYDTAVAAAGTRSAGTATVASGDSFADAVAVVPWAARRQAGILLTPHDALTAPTVDHLAGAGHAAGVVVGGTAAVGNHVDAQLHSALTGEPVADAIRSVRPLTDEERAAMTGRTWEPGCPVGLDALRVIELSHFDLTGNVRHDGQLVVHERVAEDLAGVVRRLFDARFGLHRVLPARTADGDDDALMAANVSSAFNCRRVAGTTRWSEHARGTAVDVNPVQNPWVRGTDVDPPAGRAYLDRADVRPGMVVRDGPVVEAFAAIGWGWGGDFTNSDDLQHFSLTGR